VSRIAVLALAGVLAAAPLAAAAPSSVEALPPPHPPAVLEVVPGVAYERQVRAGGQVVHVVRAPASRRLALAPVLPGGAPIRRGRLDEAVRARLDTGAVAGINGDFFNLSGSFPSGVLMIGGELISEPEPTRSALVLGPGPALAAATLALEGRYQPIDRDGQQVFPLRSFAGLNRPAERGTETLLYTPAYGSATTPKAGSRYEARVRLDAPGPLVPNQARTGTVIATGSGGGMTIGGGHVVITGVGGHGPQVVSELPLGQPVTITPGLLGLPAGTLDAIGGGPALVRDGRPITSAGEGFTGSQIASRTSRSAVGQGADGTLLLVTAEGPSQGSPGITVAEQAELLAGLGARVAIAMDAGGSAQLAVADRLVIPWAFARSLTNVLVLSYDGVRLEPLPFRLSANRDGVDDAATAVVRAPRPGTAQLTIARRTGRPTKRLWRGRLGPGAARILLDPRRLRLRDGVYVAVTRFTPDDGGAPTEQRRRLILDRTLASLSARPAARRVGRRVVPRVDIGFRLERPARATVRIRTAGDAPLATVASGRPLRAGRHRLTWNRKVRGKVVSGPIEVTVEARTRFGTPGLVTALTLEPPPRPRPRPRRP
jgi:hypothetical protein